MPEPYTEDEIREQFLNRVRQVAKYWLNLEGKTEEEKINGAMFSVLATIDGSAVELPGFQLIAGKDRFHLITNPHEDDKDFHIERGERWYPDDVDIAGSLHDQL